MAEEGKGTVTATFGDFELHEIPVSECPLGPMPEGVVAIEVHENKTCSDEEEENEDNDGPIIHRSLMFYVQPDKMITSFPGLFVNKAHEEWLLENVHYRPTDVVVLTYAKCGTTLMEQIVLLLLNGGLTEKLDPLSRNTYHKSGTGCGKVWPESCVVPNDYDMSQKPPGRPPDPEFEPMSLDAFEAIPEPRVIKSHAQVQHILSRSGGGGGGSTTISIAPAKYIIITRNMLDACVSCYYHGWNPQKRGWPFDAWALTWLEKGAEPSCGDYFEWHRGWKEMEQKCPPSFSGQTGQAEILWLHYEDLLENTREHVIKIANFIGVPPEKELIDKVVIGSSFSRMKAMAVNKASQDGGEMDRSDIYRKGVAGDWKNYFIPELEQLFRDKYAKTLSPLGLQYRLGRGEILK